MKTNIKGDFQICISVPVITICFLKMAGSFTAQEKWISHDWCVLPTSAAIKGKRSLILSEKEW